MPRHVLLRLRVRPLLIAAVTLLGCGGDGGTAPPATGNGTVTVTTMSNDVTPGTIASVTVTVVPQPSDAVVDYVRIDASGLVTATDSVSAGGPGSFSVSRTYTLPRTATGSLLVKATASVQHRIITGQTTLVANDTVPPTVQASFQPATPVSFAPGDTISVALTAGDNIALAATVVRISGAFTYTDSVAAVNGPTYVTRTAKIVIPATAKIGGQVTTSIEAIDIAHSKAVASLASVAYGDQRAPTASAVLTNSRGSTGLRPGDTLDVALTGADNYKLAYVGFALGAPANVRDSFPVSAKTFSRSIAIPVTSAWTGTSTVTTFARDSVGNTTSTLASTITVANRARVAPIGIAVGGKIGGIAYDARRNRILVAQSDSQAVAVISLGTGIRQQSIRVAGAPAGIDVTSGGDSLVAALSSTPYLEFVNMATGATDTVRVVSDNFLSPRPDHVRAMSNGKVVYTLTFSGSGYGGTLGLYDPTTATSRKLATVTEAVPLAGAQNRTRVLALIDDSCCPEDGQVYDAGSDAIVAHHGTISYYFPAVSADYSGSKFLVGLTLFDGNLNVLGTVAGGSPTVSALAPDGASAFVATSSGVQRIRVSDGAVLDTFSLGAQPSRLFVLPDGLTLVAVANGQVILIDLW